MLLGLRVFRVLNYVSEGLGFSKLGPCAENTILSISTTDGSVGLGRVQQCCSADIGGPTCQAQ